MVAAVVMLSLKIHVRLITVRVPSITSGVARLLHSGVCLGSCRYSEVLWLNA